MCWNIFENKILNIPKRSILKILVLIALLIIFYVYYFRQVFRQFSENLSNTGIYEEKIVVTEPPTITICFKPAFKPSVFKKYNITKKIFSDEFDPFPNISASKTIQA